MLASIASFAASTTWSTFLTISTLVGALSLITYLVPVLLQCILPVQNLKRKYASNGEWALVTGGSSGIGEAIAHKLAQDGVNVVIVALDDAILSEATKKLTKAYPNVQFRSVGINLANEDIMTPIIQATQDISVSMVFNNAGYIKPGLFVSHSIESIQANYNVNASCVLPVTHHFARNMIERKQRGLICFTSSSGGFLPSPMGSIYASTKAFLTTFGVSLAAELKSDAIDVVVVHPSPIDSHFYKNAGGFSALDSAKRLAASPFVIADVIWRNAGWFTVIDQGAVSVLLKTVLKALDWNFLGEIMVRLVWVNSDFQRFRQSSVVHNNKKEE